MTRVLVVEDEESISDPLSYLLRQEGFEVAVAATGPEGLAEFDRGGADIVLLDNFDDAALTAAVGVLREAAAQRGRSVSIEASGGVTRERLPAIAASGVDRVSTSALTLGVRAVDFGFDERSGARQ